jgi:hypothetical protein
MEMSLVVLKNQHEEAMEMPLDSTLECQVFVFFCAVMQWWVDSCLSTLKNQSIIFPKAMVCLLCEAGAASIAQEVWFAWCGKEFRPAPSPFFCWYAVCMTSFSIKVKSLSEKRTKQTHACIFFFYRTFLKSPRVNIVFCPPDWCRHRKIYIYS